MALLDNLIGNTKITVEVTLEDATITKFCVGLLITFTISLLIWGIIKKTI